MFIAQIFGAFEVPSLLIAIDLVCAFWTADRITSAALSKALEFLKLIQALMPRIANIAVIPITTINSIKVNAFFFIFPSET
jgi:hypothetical protein